MVWVPVSGLVPQNTESGNQSNGRVLKFYEPGTVTPLAVATDIDGNGQTTEFVLDSQGYTTLTSNRVIPHVSQKYKVALYLNQADADANDTGSAVYVEDNILIGFFTSTTGFTYKSVAEAIAIGGALGDIIFTASYYDGGNIGGATYRIVAAGTGTADGGSYIDKTDGSGYQLALIDIDRGLHLEQFGVYGTGDETTKVQNCLDFAASSIASVVHTETSFEFSRIEIPYSTTLVGGGEKNVIITSNATTGDAVTLIDDPSNAGIFFNGIKNLTIGATAARIAGSGRGLYASSGDSTKVAFKIAINGVIIENQPGIGCELVQPELADVDLITQTNGGKGFVISSTGSKGINNKIKVRAIDNLDVQIESDTSNSDFILCEALVRGGSPVYTGTLMSISGNGNRILSPDIELNGNPSEANILLCTGLVLAGDKNKLEGGFFGNLGKSVDVGGRGSYINNPKISIFSSAASDPVVGSIGINVKSGATLATVDYDEFGTTRVETYLTDLATGTATQTNGLYNGNGNVVTATSTWNPASMASGGSQTVTFSVPSATLGSPCVVGHTGITASLGKLMISAYAVNASVVVVLKNETGGIVDVPSGTLTVKVFI